MQKKVLIIGYIYPEPTTNAAGVRMMQLIDFFLSQNFQVTFSTTAEKTPFSFDLKKLGVNETPIELNSISFDVFISKLQPNIVVFDRFFTEEQFGWRVAENCPDALRILDTEDLHFLRRSREDEIFKHKPQDKYKDMVFREISSILKCDLSLIISKKEMEILTEEYNIRKDILWYFPLFFSPKKKIKSFDDRNHHLVFVGNFKHNPNTDAVSYIHRLWKKLSPALPQAEMHIYGAYTPPAIYQLHNPKKKFFINGHAKNLPEVLKSARLMLAPLRFGAGLKGKLLESMQWGLPSVTTPIGMEGITDTPDLWGGFVAETPKEILARCIALYTDKNQWSQASQKGLEILKNHFDKNLYWKEFSNKINHTTEGLCSHRYNNFMGQLLQYNHYQRNKYLSLWIAEKRKNLKN